ncbi:RloB family protein [Streptomyces kronopolitis]|uniref:RloB family protein n=1 Tax=Streptomyces kronopolitis TaxID=1612435 RepID=UPI003693944B
MPSKHTRGKAALSTVPRGGRRRRAVYVFTEGRVTERKYILAIKELVTVPADIHIANEKASDSDRMPADLVRDALALMAEKRREEKKAQLKKHMLTQVWCIFDHDGRDRNELVSLLKQAQNGGVDIAFSHPCFELWRLLHLKQATGTFDGDCSRAAVRLPRELHHVTGGIKHLVPEQIRGGFVTARTRAEALRAQHSEGKPLPDCDPYTDVDRFVEKGMGVTTY